MQSLAGMIKDSYALRFMLAIILTITVCILWLQGRAVPDALNTAWIASIGYGLGILNEKAKNTPTVTDLSIRRDE